MPRWQSTGRKFLYWEEPCETFCQGQNLLSLLFVYHLVFQRILKTNILELTVVVLSMKDKGLIQTVDLEVEFIPSFADTI
jgi:hypothetical protein